MGINDFIQIGSRIKELRMKSGISQKEMARLLNIKTSTYSNYENNYREPNADIIERIAKILDISIQYLLYGTEKEQQSNPYQAFIDFCFTLGISIETPVDQTPDGNNLHYIRMLDKNGNYTGAIYVISSSDFLDIVNNCSMYIKFLISKSSKTF